MRKLLLFSILTALAEAGRAAPDFVDTAEVVSATPILERVTESRQECDPAPAAEPATAAPTCRTVRVPRPTSPTAGMLGTNVREVTRPAPPPASAPAPPGNPGGYQYRY